MLEDEALATDEVLFELDALETELELEGVVLGIDDLLEPLLVPSVFVGGT